MPEAETNARGLCSSFAIASTIVRVVSIAAIAQPLLLPRIPPLAGDRLACEIDDRIEAGELVAPRARVLELGLHDARARAASPAPDRA